MAGKLAFQARELVGKNWSKSSLTREKLLGNLERIGNYMQSQGLQKISDMKTKHVDKFIKDMQSKNLSNSTQAGYLTVLRTLAHAIGKQNIVSRENKTYGISRAGERCMPKSPNFDKLNEIRDKLYEKNYWQGISHDLQREFGLRLKESLLSNKIIERNGERYLEVNGAKGGRIREIRVHTESQAKLITRLHDFLKQNHRDGICPQEMTLKQVLTKMSNDIHRLQGLSDIDGTSANSHALRHAFAQDKFEEGASKSEIAQELGHNREEVIKHYIK